MKITLKDILKLDEYRDRPSIEIAKALLNGGLETDTDSLFRPYSILGRYADNGYTPSFAEVELWVKERLEPYAEEFAREVAENHPGQEGLSKSALTALESALEQNLAGEIDMDTLVLKVAETFAWTDDSAFFSGTAADKYWHYAKMQSAILRLGEANNSAIDGLYDLYGEIFAQLISMLEGLLSGKSLVDCLPDVEETAKRCRSNIYTVRAANEQLTGFGIKLGFLFRDAWWIEKHGEVTIRGYLAEHISQKAGEGGSKQSTNARLNRIRYFLAAHAALIGRNPILRQDPQDEVVFRALKLAIKENQAAFKRGRTKKVAVEYWEYIKSDLQLSEEYGKILETYT